MSRICSYLYERFSSMGYECSLPRPDFMTIRWRDEVDQSVFGCFIRIKGNLVIPLWTIESSYFLSRGFSPSSLAYVLANASVDSMRSNIKVDMTEGTVVISSYVRAPFLFGSLQAVYDQVCATMLGIERKYQDILSGLELAERSSTPSGSSPGSINGPSANTPVDLAGTQAESEANWIECICGVRYSRIEPRCPACGEEPGDADGGDREREGITRCKNCGTQLSGPEPYCQNCGISLSEPDNRRESRNPSEPFECRRCGARFSSEDPDCPNCGAPIGDTGDDDEPSGDTECPYCGAQFSAEEEVCPQCGEWINEIAEEDPTERLKCPNCGAFFSNEEADCPACGVFLDTRGEDDPAASVSVEWVTNFFKWHFEATRLRKLGRIKEAFEALDKLLELDHNSEYAWIERGRLYLSIGKMSEALLSYEQALEIKPNSARAIYEKGICLAKLNRCQEANEAFNAAMRIGPPGSFDSIWAAHCLRALGRTEEALGFIVKAIEKDPNNHHLWKRKSSYLEVLGRDDEAQAALNRSDELKRIN